MPTFLPSIVVEALVEIVSFQRDLAKYEQNRAVSVDFTDSHQEFCAKQGLTFGVAALDDL